VFYRNRIKAWRRRDACDPAAGTAALLISAFTRFIPKAAH